MTDNILGQVDCPLCRHENDLKQTKANKPCLTCVSCGAQIFGRQPKSCLILVQMIKKVLPAANVRTLDEPVKKPRSLLDSLFSDDEEGEAA